ncbi:MAG: tRNA (adenosine(37)-N6)-dimethylallyltransferase MiaA [Flavobacteriales bacterium]|jgi:tRNA dimethylallyltransferase|tara:strand:+ start:13286 stop:14188 length:903 start_codon:yes stop_codon:yes gene_type:complete
MNTKTKKLIIVLGPTASGKTSLAVEIAKNKKTEIISCDSRQFFKEMSIGTAIPTKNQLKEIQHHFIHHISINEEYNAGLFETGALLALEEIFKQSEYAIMVGGSGLYINAICNGIDAIPQVPKLIRQKLVDEYNCKGLEWLQKKAIDINKNILEKIDKNNPQRLIRYLEVFEFTGKEIQSFYKKTKTKRNFEIIKVGISIERENLYKRINNRVDLMIADGLLEEVKSLKHLKHKNPLQTVGYREIFDFLDNKITFKKAIEEIKQNTRRLAKRQMTWFRKDKEIKWIDINSKEIKIAISEL